MNIINYPVYLTSMTTESKSYGVVSAEMIQPNIETPEAMAQSHVRSYENCKTTHNTRNCDISFNCPLDIVTGENDVFKVRNLDPNERQRFEKALQKALSGK